MDISRRRFLSSVGLGVTGLSLGTMPARAEEEKSIPGFEIIRSNAETAHAWVPISDRKIRMGIAGYGLCKFGAAFYFQNHPNVEVVAVSDLIPDRCAGLARDCHCDKTYPSLEEMIKDDRIEAVFVATDAPNHARHAMAALNHGKHVASAVPAVFGSLKDAEQLFETVKRTGLKYMMFETSAFHPDVYAMREIHKAGGLGVVVYSEGEYYHYAPTPLASYKGWRVGLPPMWYPTHSTGYYVAVHGGHFTEVSGMGIPSQIEHLTPEHNVYKNPFGTEIALLRTSEGGMSRMAVSWDTPGESGEMGRIRGTKGSFYGHYEGELKKLPDIRKPPLPPRVEPGSHRGSHGYLCHEFVMSIIENRKPLIDIAWALNMTVAGIVAHKSALRDGELMKIPQYQYPLG